MSVRTRALWYVLVALILGALAYWLGVASLPGQRAEAGLLDASMFTFDPPAPLSLVSLPALLISLAVIAVLAIWFHGFSRAFSIVLFGAVALVASQLLKENWLERPQLFELDAPNTFPSGHMTVFGVIAIGAIWATPRGVRGFVSVLGAVLVAVVSWQLLEYGWHRPSDLVGALALVLCAFALAAAIGPSRSKRDARSRSAAVELTNRFLGIALTVAGYLLLAGGLILIAIAASVTSEVLMLNAAEIAVIGLSLVIVRICAKLCP